MFKRLMPRARGMAYLVRRRSCHIAIGLSDPANWTEAEGPEDNGHTGS